MCMLTQLHSAIESACTIRCYPSVFVVMLMAVCFCMFCLPSSECSKIRFDSSPVS